jgi:putative phosphoesterase
MKIAFISDLHVDSSPENLKLLDHLVERLGSLNPDTFIIAGDISASTEVFEKTLKRFSAISCHKLLVAGNHDIWIDPKNGLKKGLHSGIKYRQVIPDICERNDFTCLGLEPYSINGIGFAGTIGWYDYTLRNKKYDTMFSMETYRNKRYQDKHTWNDLHFAHWMDNGGKRRKSDEEVAHEMELSLKKQLQSLVRKGVKTIVVVTHHVPFKKMVVHPNVLPFDFFSAFMGSEGLGTIILEERTVTHVICGHSHIKSSLKTGTTHAMKSPVGYFREWRTKNMTEHIGERLTCFDIS